MGRSRCLSCALGLALSLAPQCATGMEAAAPRCSPENTVHAYVVALDQVITLNRLGAKIPEGMIFALALDVVPGKSSPGVAEPADQSCRYLQCEAGNVSLRGDKRPRPLVLRLHEQDCLDLRFLNLLTPKPDGASRKASLHVQGLSWVCGPRDDGSFVGTNPSSLAQPFKSGSATTPQSDCPAGEGEAPSPPLQNSNAWTTYRLFAEHEGSFLLYSTADDWSTMQGSGDGGQLARGLFGAVNVQPSEYRQGTLTWSSEFYRSQVTEQDLCLASADRVYQEGKDGTCHRQHPESLPIVNYQATYPKGHRRESLPILNMLCSTAQTPEAVAKQKCGDHELVASDLTAIITGPSPTSGPLKGQPQAFPVEPPAWQPPSLRPIYAYPDRLQPYREFTIIYHESFNVKQAFPSCFTKFKSLNKAQDNFGINYGMSGLSAEVLANRLGVGPVANCVDCKFEEFFLSSWAMGDPAMNVEQPTTSCAVIADDCSKIVKNNCDKDKQKARYPDDPSNVYHSYMSDHLRFRVLHGGSDLHHLHHQHAQQWLGTPNSPDGDYLDSQSLGPGSAFTMEMVYNGSGNVNQTVGDSIFHCHFYPHFASGMWSLWRTHDVFEAGTILASGSSKPERTRALPDAEIAAGTPIPAVVPIPTLPMAPIPAEVRLQGACSNDPARNCFSAQECAAGDSCIQQGSRYCVVKPDTGECVSEFSTTDETWDQVQKETYRNPGYPFFIPGIAGTRAPHPPLDFAYACAKSGRICDPTKNRTKISQLGSPEPLPLPNEPAQQRQSAAETSAPIYRGSPAVCDIDRDGECEPMDGGLPRSVTALGSKKDWTSTLNDKDFSKFIDNARAIKLPEPGTLFEKVAMGTHAQRFHYDTQLPDGRTFGVCSDNQAPCSGDTPERRWQCTNPATAQCVTGPSNDPSAGVCSDNQAKCSAETPEGRSQCQDPKSAHCVTGHVNFVLNGLPPQPGAPFADPCIRFDRNGGRAPNLRQRDYLAVDLQLDAVFNKEGWHFPQERMLSLWGDAQDFLERKKPPEPLFMRVNSYDCMTYVLANLVPNVYELDDFQVRTPTDVLGQHIHLVKFDVTSSDGAANGWNYEDGTFAPNEVIERINAINKEGGIYTLAGVGSGSRASSKFHLCPKSIKFFGPGPGAKLGKNPCETSGGPWEGAQATVQRWYDDPLYNNSGRCNTDLNILCDLDQKAAIGQEAGGNSCPEHGICVSDYGLCSDQNEAAFCTQTDLRACAKPEIAECNPVHDRTIRTVFTHDHFGPSTHQQAGLYAGVVAEPKGSIWRNNQSGEPMGGYNAETYDNFPSRTVTQNGVPVQDGGPTSWQAVIETPQPGDSYREFLLEVQDSALLYQPFAVGEIPLTLRKSQVCKDHDSEPCGFCSATVFCSDDPTKKCKVGFRVCGKNQEPCKLGETKPGCADCQGLSPTRLVPCTPTKLTECLPQEPQTCNFVPGIPSTSWLAGSPIDAPGDPEAVTFNGATNSFSFNYRNEPLYPRITDRMTGKPFPGWQGDLGFVYSSLGLCEGDPKRQCRTHADCATGADCSLRPGPRGKVCSSDLAKSCGQDPKDCPGGPGDCQEAGFCADNYALCTPGSSLPGPGAAGNTKLCRTPDAACRASADSFPYLPLTAGIEPGDPFTPLLRAYAGDDVQLRVLIGAHINPHNFTLHGLNWLTEPSFVDSGWRNSQVMGISEHYNLLLKLDPEFQPAPSTSTAGPLVPWVDYLYQPGAAALEQASGNWGLIRSYHKVRPDLTPLRQNNHQPGNEFKQWQVCPRDAQRRAYTVVAMTAQQALGRPLVYNSKMGIQDPQALIFLSPQDPSVKCSKPGDWSTCRHDETRLEPLVLRAAAGECIEVTLYNALPKPSEAVCSIPVTPNPASCPYGEPCGGGLGVCQIYGWCSNAPATACTPNNVTVQCPPGRCDKGLCSNPPFDPCKQPDDCRICKPLIGAGIASEQLKKTPQSNTSLHVGLRPQLVTYDPRTSDGTNAGFDPVQTASPGGEPVIYTWYAGHIDPNPQSGASPYIPIEFGSANLLPPDPLNHYLHGLFGGLIVEPKGADWHGAMGTTADVTYTDEIDGQPAHFREFVVFTPDDSNNLRFNQPGIKDGKPAPIPVQYNLVNYGTEVLKSSSPPPRFCDDKCSTKSDVSCVLSTKSFCLGAEGCKECNFEPETPVFKARVGEPVRFRLLHPGGTNTNEVFELYGHTFSEAPYMSKPTSESCAAPTTQTNLYASQLLGTRNLCEFLGHEEEAPDYKKWVADPDKNPICDPETDPSCTEWGASLHEWKASRQGHGPSNHFDVLIDKAGGPFGRCGDYLYRSFPAFHFNRGMWGILRVEGCEEAGAAKPAGR